jgi:4-amino-4-deoxy-L-arabinose transferase-like glycosyltransferase
LYSAGRSSRSLGDRLISNGGLANPGAWKHRLTKLRKELVKPPISDSIKLELLCVGLVALISLCWALAIDGGFQGWDDLHYVQAAQNWLHNGPSLPTDHWGGRLPYVLLLTLGMMLFGAKIAALVVPNSLLFLIVIGTSWWIARLKFGPRSGFFAAVIAAATPLFFRFPQTFYPEALETAIFGIEMVLVIIAIRRPTAGKTIAILFGAGLIGGTGLVLRATSAVVPLALAFFILIEGGSRPRSAFIFICSLAIGYTIPIIAEALYYYLMTGEPFYRYAVDSKDGVVNEEMVGETILGRDVLFNFRLARLWVGWAPSAFKTHWMVNHLVNLFSTPSLLLTPYFGLAGIICSLRCERVRNFALFTLFMLGLQYILYTFVFALSPTPRYYATSVLLFCTFGGLFLAKLSFPLLRSGLLIIQIMIAVMIGLTQISPQSVVRALVIDSQEVSPIYISSPTADAAYFAFARDRKLAEGVRVGFPPIDGFALIGWDGWPRDTLKRTCGDGRPEWDVVKTNANPSIPWRVITAIYPKAASALPDRIGSYLRRDIENTVLAQRHC